MATRNINGNCPYDDCQNNELTVIVPRRPDQTIMICNSCGRYSVRVLRTGAQYPLINPNEQTSTPVIKV